MKVQQNSLHEKIDNIKNGYHADPNYTNKDFLLKSEFDSLMKVFDKDFKFVKNETNKQTEYRKKLYYTFFNYSFF